MRHEVPSNTVAPRLGQLAPSTRYQGSKRKLLPWILSNLAVVPFTSIADVMSGSASLAYAIKRTGKTVVANDYLRFNYHTAVALIENPGVTLCPAEIDWLVGSHADVDYGDFVEQTFEGMYFTTAENRWLDQTAGNIAALSCRDNSATCVYKRAIAYHALSQACLAKRPFNLFHRRNLYLRQADVPRTFGNRTTWETPFPDLFRRFLDEANQYVFDNGRQHVALNSDATKLADLPVELVYIDPPYFAPKRERARSNYRLLYHFLEGLNQYEVWPELIDRDHPLKALRNGNHSGDRLFTCQVKDVEAYYLSWLGELVAQWPQSKIAISYKHPGLPSVGLLRKLLVETGRSVVIRACSYTYALSKSNGKPKENIEVLLIGM